MLQVGIVGLPNVGKSTLFNALTRSRKAEAANYPFCTIEPNVGRVNVPDSRLEPLSVLSKTQRTIPAAIEFVDIAGLVAGASKGEGLGNQFLSHIRQVDAIVHVVRCFQNDDIVHSMGRVDPLSDLVIIQTELILADLESVESQIQRQQKKAKAQDKEALANLALLEPLQALLAKGEPASHMQVDAADRQRFQQFGLITQKPMILACNVQEEDLKSGGNAWVKAVRDQQEPLGVPCCLICAALEAELSELEPQEAALYLQELGVHDSGVSQLIQSSYRLLGLASYFTAGEQEVRAWTFRQGMKAPECAGIIHTDFEHGFIKAEVVSYPDLIAAGSLNAARQAGKVRLEGKDYLFQDGDVAHFRFNR